MTGGSREGDQTHPVLVNNVDDDDEAAVVLAVVHQGHPPDQHEPLERLYKHKNKATMVNNQDHQREGDRKGLTASWISQVFLP